MLGGYMRISKNDRSQIFDLQKDALLEAGVEEGNIYADHISGKKEERPGLTACLKVLRKEDTPVGWKLDRLGHNLKHLPIIIDDLEKRRIGFKVLKKGQSLNIDTTAPNGKIVFGIFATFAEYERALISERTKAGLTFACARGKLGDRLSLFSSQLQQKLNKFIKGPNFTLNNRRILLKVRYHDHANA